MNARITSKFRYPARTVLALVLLVVVAFLFWTGSRYPDLNDKALMGGSIQLQDPLSFEARYQIDPSWAIWKKIGFTTLNWIFTNLRGMTFGVLFGAGMLTLLRYLPKRGFKNGFANSFAGFLIGAPLGVCVNCAAPIAAGMYTGGSRAETTLSAMIASPTFNVIVLSMAISLFPFYLVVIKVALTLLIILVIIPLLCRLLPKNQLSLADDQVNACVVAPKEIDSEIMEQPEQVVTGFIQDFAKNLWFIIKMTVPLMFLAGLLGATLATLVPFEWFSGLPVNAVTLISAAVVGILAPVPIGFDIILAAVLLASGTKTTIVMVLLFTLGSYSIYSHIVVSRTISSRIAIYLAASIIVTAIIGGIGAGLYDDWQINQGMKALGVFGVIE